MGTCGEDLGIRTAVFDGLGGCAQLSVFKTRDISKDNGVLL